MHSFEIDGSPIALNELARIAQGGVKVSLSAAAAERMRASRKAITDVLHQDGAVYGINTGFGKLADVRIADRELEQLQVNLVRSHACGVGQPLPADEVRAMLLLRANVLAKGLSGARVEVADALLAMLNHDILPVVPAKG
jgi:histidine ammonia-lyase